MNRNLSNCENSPKKVFRGFNGIRTRGLCVSAPVLSQLNYEDPYTGCWPIYWVHQPVKGMKHWMKWCELREYKWNEYVTIAVNRNLSNCSFHLYSRSSHHFIQCLTNTLSQRKTILRIKFQAYKSNKAHSLWKFNSELYHAPKNLLPMIFDITGSSMSN